MFRFLIMIVVAVLYQQVLVAAPFTTNDFAYTASLSPAKTSIRQLDLPLDVYKKMIRQDYGDLRIFNGEGQIVPHQSRSIDPLISKQRKELTFYPFTKEQSSNPNKIRLVINQAQGRQSIELNQQLGIDKNVLIKEHRYIIINPKPELSLCKLELDWIQNKPNLILPFKLEGSSNLQNWQIIKRRLTVSKLNYGGSQLYNNQVSFPCTKQKYLRISWLDAKQNIHLKAITGVSTKNTGMSEQWSNLGKPRYNDEGEWLFENNTIAALTKIEFIAPQDGLLYKGSLYSRNDEKKDWRYQKDVNQYRLNMGESLLQSKAIELSPNHHRYWKLKLDTETRFSELQLPEIRISWPRKQLYFLAQGKGPFTLAFGNPSVKVTQNNDLDALIASIKDSGASIDKVMLGAVKNNEKSFEPASEIPWKLILLWAVLIIGTMLMGLMAYRLYQQMGDQNNK